MKENVLDVLMYLFDNYMDSDIGFASDQETLSTELERAGFRMASINKAFTWLEDLATLHEQQPIAPIMQPITLRIYTEDESNKLGLACRGFLLYLEQVGVLDTSLRELVLDRIMALDAPEIDVDQLKWITLMVLFNYSDKRRDMGWLEDLVFGEAEGSLH
jgi:Smg protein